MNEEEVLALLVSAEERAKRDYEAFQAVDGGELGWVGRERQTVLKEKWATARALRELYEDPNPNVPEGQPTARGPQRKGM